MKGVGTLEKITFYQIPREFDEGTFRWKLVIHRERTHLLVVKAVIQD